MIVIKISVCLVVAQSWLLLVLLLLLQSTSALLPFVHFWWCSGSSGHWFHILVWAGNGTQHWRTPSTLCTAVAHWPSCRAEGPLPCFVCPSGDKNGKPLGYLSFFNSTETRASSEQLHSPRLKTSWRAIRLMPALLPVSAISLGTWSLCAKIHVVCWNLSIEWIVAPACLPGFWHTSQCTHGALRRQVAVLAWLARSIPECGPLPLVLSNSEP